MVFPNLTNARLTVERLMSETGEITRDPDPADEPEFDPNTGEIVEAQPVVVYSGKCKVKYEGSATRDEGGRLAIVQSFSCAIPLDSEPIYAGDWFTLLASARDPMLVGVKLLVTDVVRTTMAVQRKFTAEAVAASTGQARP